MGPFEQLDNTIVAEYLIGTRSTRSIYEITWKTIAIAITTNTASGHLTTLLCISKSDRADIFANVVLFLLLPTLPCVALLYYLCYSMLLACIQGWKESNLLFFLSAACGMRATVVLASSGENGNSNEVEDSIPLIHESCTVFTRVPKAYDLEWFGRLIVLFCFEVQAVATASLVIRRIVVTEGASWDIYILLLALGGVVTGLRSICITLLNCSWKMPEPESGDADLRQSNSLRAAIQAFHHFPFGPKKTGRKSQDLMIQLGLAMVSMWLVEITLMRPVELGPVNELNFPHSACMYIGRQFCLENIIDLASNSLLISAAQLRQLEQAFAYLYIDRIFNRILLVLFLLLGVGRGWDLICGKDNFPDFLLLTTWIWKYRILWAWFESLACAIILIIWDLYIFVILQRNGWWLKSMWVDPWAEKLYVF